VSAAIEASPFQISFSADHRLAAASVVTPATT
jgi:hypothetical protein